MHYSAWGRVSRIMMTDCAKVEKGGWGSEYQVNNYVKGNEESLEVSKQECHSKSAF